MKLYIYVADLRDSKSTYTLNFEASYVPISITDPVKTM